MRARWIPVLALTLATLALAASGCADTQRLGSFAVSRSKAAVIPPPGILYGSTSAPVWTGVSGEPLGTRTGRSVAHSIGIPPNPFTGLLGIPLFSWGDMSEQAAMADGGITTPTHADYEMVSVLMLYRRMTLVVHGD